MSGGVCVKANTVVYIGKDGGSGTLVGTGIRTNNSGTGTAYLDCNEWNCTIPNLSASTVTRTGYTLVTNQLCTSTYGRGTCYNAGSTYVFSGNITLYLHWDCAAGYYSTNNTTCSVCTNTLPSNASWSGIPATTATCPWTCNAGYHEENGACVLDARTCAAGTYWNGSACADCGGNAYWCPGFTDVTNPAAGYGRNNVSSGYYSTGGSATTRTGQTQCTGATYCSGGVQSSCPTGYTANTTAGKTVATQCQISCAAGTRVAAANAACTTPAGAWYSAAHTVNYGSTSTGTGNQTCPTGYTVSLAANNAAVHDSAADCQISCAAGTRVAAANAACTTPAGGWFTAAHIVNYSNVSTVNYCASPYTSTGTTAATHDAATDCTATIAAGKQVTANTVQARYVQVTGNGNNMNAYNHVTEIQAFAARDGTGTNLLSGKGGTKGINLTNATDGVWNNVYAECNTADCIWDMGTVQTLGSLRFQLFPGPRTYKDVTIRVSTDNVNWVTVFGPTDVTTTKTGTEPGGNLLVLSAPVTDCAIGSARSGAVSVTLGNTLACAACTGASYADAAGMAACTQCPKTTQNGSVAVAGYQALADGLHDSPYKCWTGVPWDTVQQSGTAHGTGRINCYYVSGADGSAQYGNIVGNGVAHPSGGGNDPGAGTCDNATPGTCDAGYYYEGNRYKSSCVPVGAGYYSPADDLTRNQCSVDAPGYPNSEATSDAITDCYSGTKSRAWAGTQTACATPDGCTSKTCNSCTGAACDYTAYANAAGTGDGTLKSGCATNTAACQQTVATVTANAGRYVSGTTCPACPAGTYNGTDGSTATSCADCGMNRYCPLESTAPSVCPANDADLAALSGGTILDQTQSWTNGAPRAGSINKCMGDTEITVDSGTYLAECSWNGTNYYDNCNGHYRWYSCNNGYYLQGYKSTSWMPWYSTCAACTGLPANASWTGAGTPETDDCPWECAAGFKKSADGTQCVCATGYSDLHENGNCVSTNCSGGSGTGMDSCPGGEAPVCANGLGSPLGIGSVGPWCFCGVGAGMEVDGNTGNCKCKPGYYPDGNTCTICPPGHYCPDGVSGPIPAPIGTAASCTGYPGYEDLPMSSQAGGTETHDYTSCPDTGRVDYDPCPTGTYQDQTGQGSCKSCPPLPGKTMNFGNPTVSSSYESTAAAHCYVTTPGVNLYERLDVGYGMFGVANDICYWNGSDYLDCDKTYRYCEFGHYIDNTTPKAAGYTNRCMPCAAGTSNNKLGASNGYSTIDGTPVVNRTTATACDGCAGGTYQDLTGQATCKHCPTAPYATPWVGSQANQLGNYWGWPAPFVSPNSCHLVRSLRDSGKAAHGDGTILFWYSSGTDGNAVYNGSFDQNYITSCDAGYWSANPIGRGDMDCAPVTPGYWSADGPTGRTACTNKVTNSHYTDALAATANCAWTCDTGYLLTLGGQCAAVCPHPGLQTLRVGSQSIPLYVAKNTERVVAIGLNGNVCYANMASGESAGALNVNINGTTWHTIQ